MRENEKIWSELGQWNIGDTSIESDEQNLKFWTAVNKILGNNY